jgi:RimJ/RimL family protein N-acetyltransferase
MDALVTLAAPMREAELRIEPAADEHRKPLRAACAEDQQIWDIYPISFLDGHFDRNFDAMLAAEREIPFVFFESDRLIGMSSFLAVDEINRNLEIGRTYLVPSVRGTGLNRRIKRLMLDRAFGEGFVRVTFKVDTRNTRSMAAVRKLGATHEGILRKDRITWTGYVRDTAIFSILADEWAELRA